jgi:hypothetical protein
MNKNYFYFLLAFILLGNFFATAQNKGSNSKSTSSIKTNLSERIHIGGNLSGGVANDYYFLTVAPRVSMDVTKWFVPGATVVYMYSQETGDNRVTTNTYGAGVFTDIYPIKYVFGHVEYQHLWYDQKVQGGSEPGKLNFDDNFLLMGVGAKVPVTSKMAVTASILFNVLNNERSEYYMYKNPIYSVGIDVGL